MTLAPKVTEAILEATKENYRTEQAWIDSIEILPEEHPDRVIDKAWRDRLCPWKKDLPYNEPTIVYTHTATVRYWHSKDNCSYLATYGVTDTNEFHLWMD